MTRKFYVNFLLKKRTLEVNILEDTENMYVPIYTTLDKNKTNDLDSLVICLEKVKKFIRKLKLKKHNEIFYSLIVDDSMYESFKFINVEEEFKLEKAVDANIYNQYQEFLKGQYHNDNNIVLNSETYLFEVLNDKSKKKFAAFPFNKEGQTLLVHQGIFVVRKNTNLAAIIETFKENNINLKQIKLESQCLVDRNLPRDNYSLLVNFNWKTIIVSGFFNAKTFYYEKIDCDVNSLVKFFKEELNLNSEQINLHCKAVMNNWKVYDTTRMTLRNVEQQVYNYLNDAAKEVVNTVQEIISKKLNMQEIEIIFRGKNKDFLLKKFKENNPPLAVSTYDDTDASLSNVKDYSLGAVYLINDKDKPKENLVNTLQNLPDYKPRNVFVRFFSKLLASVKNRNLYK